MRAPYSSSGSNMTIKMAQDHLKFQSARMVVSGGGAATATGSGQVSESGQGKCQVVTCWDDAHMMDAKG